MQGIYFIACNLNLSKALQKAYHETDDDNSNCFS